MTNSAAAVNSPVDNSGQREFTLSDQEFNDLRKVIKEVTGINMGDSKRQLIYRRLSGRLRATGSATFADYLHYLRNNAAQELETFTNAVTTNLTSFFRESHHFDYLANTIFPEIQKNKLRGSRRMRIWSSGCSTGEEPYSIAMTVKESFEGLAAWDAKILATDLDSDVLRTASAGRYNGQRVENVDSQILQRYFQANAGGMKDQYQVRSDVQKLITFRQLNLMGSWPMSGKFDVIFCRNVIIYFDKPTQRVLMDRYAELLEEGGYLVLGHSESLFNVSDRFELLGKTIYRKVR